MKMFNTFSLQIVTKLFLASQTHLSLVSVILELYFDTCMPDLLWQKSCWAAEPQCPGLITKKIINIYKINNKSGPNPSGFISKAYASRWNQMCQVQGESRSVEVGTIKYSAGLKYSSESHAHENSNDFIFIVQKAGTKLLGHRNTEFAELTTNN